MEHDLNTSSENISEKKSSSFLDSKKWIPSFEVKK